VFEGKQVSGKERENCRGSRDEETSSRRDAVMGNTGKICGRWLSADLRKLGIFNDWFFCTYWKRTRRIRLMVIYIYKSICSYTCNHLP